MSRKGRRIRVFRPVRKGADLHARHSGVRKWRNESRQAHSAANCQRAGAAERTRQQGASANGRKSRHSVSAGLRAARHQPEGKSRPKPAGRELSGRLRAALRTTFRRSAECVPPPGAEHFPSEPPILLKTPQKNPRKRRFFILFSQLRPLFRSGRKTGGLRKRPESRHPERKPDETLSFCPSVKIHFSTQVRAHMRRGGPPGCGTPADGPPPRRPSATTDTEGNKNRKNAKNFAIQFLKLNFASNHQKGKVKGFRLHQPEFFCFYPSK